VGTNGPGATKKFQGARAPSRVYVHCHSWYSRNCSAILSIVLICSSMELHIFIGY